MALVAGSVSISATGSASGTGLAKALYDARSARVVFAPSAAGVPAKTILAQQCSDDASAIITYLVANAVVNTTVTTPQGAGTGVGTIS